MKNVLLKNIIILSFVFILVSCQSRQNDNNLEQITEIVVGATVLPHAEFLNLIVDDLAEQNVKLNVREFSDYLMLNEALVNGDIDANFFQHVPYLESYISDTGNELTVLGSVHIEPMGAYSSRITDINDLSDGSEIAIPNDPSNGARALLLLQEHNIIKLRENLGVNATIYDIVENPKQLNFRELDAAQLTRTLSDVDLAFINTNYALLADLKPNEDALIIEDGTSLFANVVVVRKGDETREEFIKLINSLQSDMIKTYINENYGSSIIAAF